MAISAIKNGFLLPILQQTSALANRVKKVISKNSEATEEAQVIGMLTTVGAGFGFFGRSVVGLGTNNSSLKSSFFWSLIGGLAGMAVSTPLIYSFVSQFHARESAPQVKAVKPKRIYSSSENRLKK